MGNIVVVPLDVYKAVFKFLDSNFRGMELVILKQDNLKEANSPFIRITNTSNKKSVLLRKKDVIKYFKYIEKETYSKILVHIKEKHPFLKNQIIKNNTNNNKKKLQGGSFDIKEKYPFEITESSSNNYLLKNKNGHLFDGLIDKGALKYDSIAEAYYLLVLDKKKNKTKEKEYKMYISKKISSKIDALNDRGPNFIEISEKLRNSYPIIKKNMREFFITPDCFAASKNSFDNIDVLKERIAKWNNLYSKEIFTLKDFDLLCNGIVVSKNNFSKIYNSDCEDTLVDNISKMYKETINDLRYIGSKNLEKFFSDNFEKDAKYIDNQLNMLREMSSLDLTFISKNLRFFNEIYSKQGVFEKLFTIKNEIHYFEFETFRRYNYIKIKKGPLTIIYSEKDGNLKRDYSNSREINDILDDLRVVCLSGSIDKYKKLYVKLKSLISKIPGEILEHLISKYDLESTYLDKLKKDMKKDNFSMVGLKIVIRNGTMVYLNEDCVHFLSEEEINTLMTNKVNSAKSVLLNIYDKKVADKINTENKIREVLIAPQNYLIVSCIKNLDKKGITTYASVLSGKKHLSNDDEYFGKLKDYGYDFVLDKIKYLIDAGVLHTLQRSASFGVYESIELMETAKTVYGSVSNEDLNSTFDDEESNLTLSLSEYILKSNNFRSIKKYFKLRSINIEDVKFLIDTFSKDLAVSKKVVNNFPNILKDCEKLSLETIFFIRLQINLTKETVIKFFLNEILSQDKIKGEV